MNALRLRALVSERAFGEEFSASGEEGLPSRKQRSSRALKHAISNAQSAQIDHHSIYEQSIHTIDS